MRIDQQSLIYDASLQDASGRIAFFDGLLPLDSGTWISGFTTGQTKHHHAGTIRLSRSRDNGATWELSPWRFQSTWNGVAGSLAGAEMVETDSGRLLVFTKKTMNAMEIACQHGYANGVKHQSPGSVPTCRDATLGYRSWKIEP